MSQLGQKRRFDRGAAVSALPRSTDIIRRARLVGLILPELQNPIFPAFAEVVEDFLERHEAFLISRTDTLIHP